MNVQYLRFVTVEQFLAGNGCGTDMDLLQLSPGRLDFTSTLVELPGILLEWNRVGARIRACECDRASGVKFGFVRQSPTPLKLGGLELDYGNAVLWQRDEELEYIAPTGLASLVIHVDAALADLLGWTLASGVFRPVPAVRLSRLEQTCRLATWAARKQVGPEYDKGTNCAPAQDSVQWRDRILADLEPALEPWLTPDIRAGNHTFFGTPHFRLVKDTERFFERYDLGQSMTVDAVAEALGVARRTLFRAFREWADMGPHAYLLLVRLHRLRDRLLAGSPADTSVTKLAIELGFNHMGRLSAAYRRHFGEYPKETLARK